VGSRFSAPVHTGPGANPASYTMGTGSFPGVQRSGRGVDHPPPSSAEVKERVELYLYCTSRPSWSVLGRPLPLPLPILPSFGGIQVVAFFTCLYKIHIVLLRRNSISLTFLSFLQILNVFTRHQLLPSCPASKINSWEFCHLRRLNDK